MWWLHVSFVKHLPVFMELFLVSLVIHQSLWLAGNHITVWESPKAMWKLSVAFLTVHLSSIPRGLIPYLMVVGYLKCFHYTQLGRQNSPTVPVVMRLCQVSQDLSGEPSSSSTSLGWVRPKIMVAYLKHGSHTTQILAMWICCISGAQTALLKRLYIWMGMFCCACCYWYSRHTAYTTLDGFVWTALLSLHISSISHMVR